MAKHEPACLDDCPTCYPERWAHPLRAHRKFTQDEPGECFATKLGQRETHDLGICEHYLSLPPAESLEA